MLTLAAVGACGSDGTSAPDPTTAVLVPAPTTTTTPMPPVSTSFTPSTARTPSVTELQEAVSAYDRAYAAATAAPGDPSHRLLLEATTDGPLRHDVQAQIADRRERGEALRAGRSGAVLHQVVTAVAPATDGEAHVTTCVFNGAELYVVATGEVVDPEEVAGENELVLRHDDDGVWRIDAATSGNIHPVEADPCG